MRNLQQPNQPILILLSQGLPTPIAMPILEDAFTYKTWKTFK